MNLEHHVDKVGVVGAIVATLCCLGVTAVVSVVAALGLGFLINDAVLAPLLVLSLVLVVWGLVSGWRRHGNSSAFALGISAGVTLVVFAYLHQSKPLAYLSMAGLVTATVLNVVFTRHPPQRGGQPAGARRSSLETGRSATRGSRRSDRRP
jgi:mercuric ion transport protein